MIALPNYDTWKTNPKTYEIEYRAEGCTHGDHQPRHGRCDRSVRGASLDG